MLNIRLMTLAVASVPFLPIARAANINEAFNTNPFQHGWKAFGNTNSFRWDATNHALAVTWDSREPNSYCYYPFGGYLTRNDDFQIEFDLRLNDITNNIEAGKTGPLQLGFGFLNLAGATTTNFMRGSFGSAPNVAEFDYYTDGYYDFGGTRYDAAATTTPSFISGVDSYDYAPAILSVYDNVLPTNQTVHVSFGFTASNQTAVVAIRTTNGPLGSLPNLVLDSAHGFADTDDFHVDVFSISSYSSVGDDFDSVLAHGSVQNVAVTLPPPVQGLRGGFVQNTWTVQFYNHKNWHYTLQRTADMVTWIDASTTMMGNGTNLVLQDLNAPPGQGFYRVRAERP